MFNWTMQQSSSPKLPSEDLSGCSNKQIDDMYDTEAKPETKATSNCSKELLGAELWEVVVNHPHLMLFCNYCGQIASADKQDDKGMHTICKFRVFEKMKKRTGSGGLLINFNSGSSPGEEAKYQ